MFDGAVGIEYRVSMSFVGLRKVQNDSERFVLICSREKHRNINDTWIFKRHKFLPETFFSEKTP